MQAVWGYAAPGRTRTLDSHACRLRGNLASVGAEGYIANRWGQGYMLRPLAFGHAGLERVLGASSCVLGS